MKFSETVLIFYNNTMGKVESLITTVNEISLNAKNKGIVHLYTEDKFLNGRIITIDNKELINFGSCSYLGLEVDSRLKKGAIDAVTKFGTQFSSSRTYVSCGNYKEFEQLIQEVFGYPVLLSTCSSLGHQSVMPIVISSDDVVIYDQQAHISMQEMSYKLSSNGSRITMIRHSILKDLENKIIEFRDSCKKIWYIIDGVYSMYGDFAPLKELIELMNKYKQLYLYVDDAHGMSWAGKNGCGYVLSQIELHPRMILATSLAKGFGSCGGIFVFPNENLRDKVKFWGGPITYSGPQQPATVGASIASAKIHLSKEIDELQKSLRDKIIYCNKLLEKYKLPVVSNSEGPIFFVGVGLTRMGYNMIHRLMNEGFYTNLGIFPAVPESCTGIRFTITNHHSFSDIEMLVKNIAFHFPKALEEEGRTMNDIVRAFKKIANLDFLLTNNDTNLLNETNADNKINIEIFESINQIDKKEWNNLLGDRGAFDYDNLLFLESIFLNNIEIENNWQFKYFIVRDSAHKPILATFFTLSLVKDDMMSPAKVSLAIEETRKSEPYYLTSKTYMMGSQLTNGEHLFLDKNSPHWKDALMLMLDAVWNEQDNNGATVLFLRDFNQSDFEIRDFFMNNGFVKVDMEDNCVVNCKEKGNSETFFQTKLDGKKRYFLKRDILSKLDLYETKIENCKMLDVNRFYELYLNVKNNNLALNTFKLPIKLFEKVSQNKNWEIIQLFEKSSQKLVSVGFCLKTENSYCPMILGMDYSVENPFVVYKQSLYHVIKRGFELNAKRIHLGVTASESKRKLGADVVRQVAYIQLKDHYSTILLENMESSVVSY
ncbi:MAG: aminotransferase class I/II-fold pyridoxal phosphate-dependent enzyme [Bacteroidota bacterium]